MKMAANSNTGVPQGAIQASVFNDHVFSLLSGARNVSIGMTLPVESSGGINSSHGMILPVGSSGGINSSTGMILPVESSGGIHSSTGMDPTENSSGMSNMAGLVPGGCSSSGLLLDMVPGLSQDTGMVVDWSIKEQSILEEGLVRYVVCIMLFCFHFCTYLVSRSFPCEILFVHMMLYLSNC